MSELKFETVDMLFDRFHGDMRVTHINTRVNDEDSCIECAVYFADESILFLMRRGGEPRYKITGVAGLSTGKAHAYYNDEDAAWKHKCGASSAAAIA